LPKLRARKYHHALEAAAGQDGDQRLAALTQAPNDSFAELRQVYAGDDRLRVPPAVRNAVRQRDEVR
jgi:hypothetical protein